MKLIAFSIFVFLIEQSSGVIYRLNATQHDHFPDMFRLDNYGACLREPDGLYCTVDIQLVSEQPNELMMLIKDYSEHRITHYNHSRLHHSICVTQACKKFLNTTEARIDVRETIEACVNESLWEKYRLKGIVDKKIYCSTEKDHEINLGIGDIVVAIVLLTIFGLNLIGTLYELYCMRRGIKHRNRLLMCFSLLNNWRRLVAPAGDGPDPRMKRLVGLNGIKSWSTTFVIFGHAPIAFIVGVDNSHDFEEMYHNILYHILFNGTLIVQTFFMITGLLLAINILIYKEKRNVTLMDTPKLILLRYARLTPAYAVVLAVISTWFRFAGTGPLWKRVVQIEVDDCSKYWYSNLLYVNNYQDETQCMAHTWYLAADMQLYVVGVIFCIVMTSRRAQKLGLWMLFIIGVIVPGVHTYVQNLDAILVASPETIFNIFVFDPTFNNVYKRGHTNLAAFTIGLAMGYGTYHHLTHKYEETCRKFQSKRHLTWVFVPGILLYFFVGAVFYADGPEMPLIVKALYASLMKPLFCMNICIIILTVIFKSEKLYRGILEWRGFTATARVSYCAYLLHVMIIRAYSGVRTGMLHISFFQAALLFFGLLFLTFLAAFPLFLMVEAPFNLLCKLVFAPAPVKIENFDRNVVPKTIELNVEDNKERTDKEFDKL